MEVPKLSLRESISRDSQIMPPITQRSSSRTNITHTSKQNQMRREYSRQETPRIGTPDKLQHSPSQNIQQKFKATISPTSFESNFKINLIGYLKNEQKSPEDMKFLKKHLTHCGFFHHIAIPMGEDVFEKSIQQLQVKFFPANSTLIQRGDPVEVMYILLSGQLTRLVDMPSSPTHKHKQEKKDHSLDSLNQTIDSNSQFIKPISSMLEGPFMESGYSPDTIIALQDCAVGFLQVKDFNLIVASSANRELILSLSQLRSCAFFKDWSLIKLKPILSNSIVVPFQLHQSVYRQDDKATNWYVVLEGEFEYLKEIHLESEKDEFLISALDTHVFKKQTGALAEQKKKYNIQVKVSIITKGEVIGVEELLPKSKRLYTVRCLTSKGTLRQVSENYFAGLQIRSEDEIKKFIEFGESKREWLEKSTQKKIPMAKQYHLTILESKRNLAIQMMKKREEEKEQEIVSTVNNMNNSDKPIEKLKGAKNPITFLPNQIVTFIKPEPKEDQSKILQRQLVKEYRQMKEAKDDLLSSYRVTVEKFFVNNNQRLYQKVIHKKDPLGENIETVESEGQKSSSPTPRHFRIPSQQQQPSPLGKQQEISPQSKQNTRNSRTKRNSKSEHQLASLPESPERAMLFHENLQQFSSTQRMNSQQTAQFRDTQYSRLNLKLFQDSPNLIERSSDRTKFLSEKKEKGFDLPQDVIRILRASTNTSPSDTRKTLPNTPSNQRLEQLLSARSLYFSQKISNETSKASETKKKFFKFQQEIQQKVINQRAKNCNLIPHWIGQIDIAVGNPRKEFPARLKLSSSKSILRTHQHLS